MKGRGRGGKVNDKRKRLKDDEGGSKPLRLSIQLRFSAH